MIRAVFFNIFFEVEPFAAILIAHGSCGTHGHSQECVLGGLVRPTGLKFMTEGREWGRCFGEEQPELIHYC